MPENLLNIRMHASLSGRHLSGAERLIEPPEQADELLLEMLQRALGHPRGCADRINLRVEEVPRRETRTGSLLPFSGFQVESWEQGRMLACRLLSDAGVSLAAATGALERLAAGAAGDGSAMRGAMLVDARTGARLEPDRCRGVRVSRMDLSSSCRRRLREQLAELELDNAHVVEALTLASKVLAAPQIVAELCWSDDPDYLAGYVASAAGYQRIDLLKPAGEERGGRAFFVRADGPELAALIDFLEQTPFLIEQVAALSRPVPWRE